MHVHGEGSIIVFISAHVQLTTGVLRVWFCRGHTLRRLRALEEGKRSREVHTEPVGKLLLSVFKMCYGLR